MSTQENRNTLETAEQTDNAFASATSMVQHIVEAIPEGFEDMRNYYRLYLRLLFVTMNIGRSKQELQQEASASDYIMWHAQREQYRAAWRASFRKWDVLLAPVNIVSAFPHTDAPWLQRSLKINGQNVPYDRQSAYPAIATLCGQPATAFPVGLTSAGLPIGLQAIGPYLEDRTPMRFATLVAQEFGGFHRPPGY